MKRVVIASSVIGFVFFPVFALQAEKLSAPLPSPKVVASANPEILPADEKLKSTLVTVRYPESSDKKFSLVGDCATVAKAVWSSVSPSGIRTEILPVTVSSNCPGKSLELFLSSSWKRLPASSLSVPLIREEALFVEFADFSDDALFLYARNARESSASFSERSKAALSASGATAKDKLEALSFAYKASALEYRSKTASRMSDARKALKYVVPVAVKNFPSEYPRIPGGGRPYRKATTDGIHHWWDLMAPVGTPVRALADGVVIRTVSGFAWKDFERIVKGANISEDARHLNLDVYRGNQIWLKTADGNVSFYSHLSAIAPDIREGKRVSAWEILWNVGISGVPDRAYGEPHLHLEIQKNPHDGGDSATPLSVMRWPYLGKWMGKAEINAFADEIFAK